MAFISPIHGDLSRAASQEQNGSLYWHSRETLMNPHQMLVHAKDGVPPGNSRTATTSVLLVDDDVGMGQMLTEYLAGEMIQLQTVQDGWMAHELLHVPDHGFDLLLLDVTLPGQSGFDIL